MPKRVAKRVGFRGSILLVFCTFGLFFGLGNLGTTPPPVALANAQVITHLAPLVFWYGFWTAVGVICIIGAFWKSFDPFAYAAWIFASLVFAFGYSACQVLAWQHQTHAVQGIAPLRPWVSALLFGVLAFMGYIESRRP